MLSTFRIQLIESIDCGCCLCCLGIKCDLQNVYAWRILSRIANVNYNWIFRQYYDKKNHEYECMNHESFIMTIVIYEYLFGSFGRNFFNF